MIIRRTHPLAPSLPPIAALLARPGRRLLRAALPPIDGGHVTIELPGGEVWSLGDPRAADHCAVRVDDDRFFARALLRGELGLGESYVAGEWSASDLVGVLRIFLRNLSALGPAIDNPLARVGRLPDIIRHRRRQRGRAAARRNIGAHYDLGNDFYRLFLDAHMVYSCALFEQPGATLEAAQEAKLERLCALLELGPDDHLLDLGCGWGALAMWAARTRGCRVTGVTLSRQQHELARTRVAAAGLGDRVHIEQRDYRDLRGRYDKIASVEMLEAIGEPGLSTYFHHVDNLLGPGGTAVVQTITMPDDRYAAYCSDVDWMQTYVFPGSVIPSPGAIDRALSTTRLRVVEHHEIGPHYVPTLTVWRRRFRDQIEAARALGIDAAFERTWELYLAFSEAAFAERTLGNRQIVMRRSQSRRAARARLGRPRLRGGGFAGDCHRRRGGRDRRARRGRRGGRRGAARGAPGQAAGRRRGLFDLEQFVG